MREYVIAYDIFEKKRLKDIHRIVADYSLGGQKSSYEAKLDKDSMKTLVNRLLEYMHSADKVNIVEIKGVPLLLGRAVRMQRVKNSFVIT